VLQPAEINANGKLLWKSDARNQFGRENLFLTRFCFEQEVDFFPRACLKKSRNFCWKESTVCHTKQRIFGNLAKCSHETLFIFTAVKK